VGPGQVRENNDQQESKEQHFHHVVCRVGPFLVKTGDGQRSACDFVSEKAERTQYITCYEKNNNNGDQVRQVDPCSDCNFPQRRDHVFPKGISYRLSPWENTEQAE